MKTETIVKNIRKMIPEARERGCRIEVDPDAMEQLLNSVSPVENPTPPRDWDEVSKTHGHRHENCRNCGAPLPFQPSLGDYVMSSLYVPGVREYTTSQGPNYKPLTTKGAMIGEAVALALLVAR